MGCLCNHFQSQKKPKGKICQAAAGGLQTIHDIWWKFKLTYVIADNKQTAGEYDSCYPWIMLRYQHLYLYEILLGKDANQDFIT